MKMYLLYLRFAAVMFTMMCAGVRVVVVGLRFFNLNDVE